MRICDNGVYRDATPEEEAEFMTDIVSTETTTEERLSAIESAMLDIILGGDSDV